MPTNPTPFKVTLLKGPNREPRTWEHSTKRAAQVRAHALCKLHSVAESTWNDRTLTFVVDATAFYSNS